jgi:hypothetical protein
MQNIEDKSEEIQISFLGWGGNMSFLHYFPFALSYDYYYQIMVHGICANAFTCIKLYSLCINERQNLWILPIWLFGFFLFFSSIKLEFEINIRSPLLFQNGVDVLVLSLDRFIMFKDELNFHFYSSFWTCMEVFELIISWLWTMCSHHYLLCMLVGKQWMKHHL